jgi:hypothetical protein
MMLMFRICTGMALAFVALTAADAPAQSMPSEAEIVAANGAYWGAFIRGDVETMAQHETATTAIIDNGVLLPGASERFAGIRKRGTIPNRTDTLEVLRFNGITSDSAIITGVTHRKVGAREGRAAATELWQRENGRWRIALGTYGPFIASEPATAIPGAVRRDAVDRDLLAAINRRDDAVRRSDGAAWSKEVTDRHLNLPPNGAVRTSTDRIANITSAPPGSFSESQDEQFIVYGNSLVIYLYVQDAGAGRARYVETWIKEPGGWKLALRQGTPM